MKKNDDGSTTYSFTLDGDSLRPVEDGVVAALDAALEQHGPVMHAIDPSRLQRFDAGGPPVWSVGFTRVDGPRPYWLLLTYGFSGVLTPVPYREGFTHEYSLAVPATDEAPPIWAPALLRHLCRYVLKSGAELKLGDNMPCMHAITQIPFALEQHAQIRSTELDTLLVGADPVLGTIATPNGEVEVRRFVGALPAELALIETWNCRGFLHEWSQDDPLLITDPDRTSVLTGELAVRCSTRAAEEGSSVGQLFFEGGWTDSEDAGLELYFPGGHQARRIKDVLRARLPFDRPLFLVGPDGAGTVVFVPDNDFRAEIQDDQLVFYGNLHHRELQQILSFLQPDGPGSVVRLG